MNQRLQGIYTALLTPFGSDGRVNGKSLEKLIERNIGQGVAGFYVGGSTAEAFLLTEDERKELYKTVKAIAGDRVKLIAHVGAISTAQSIAFATAAQDAGYDAVSSIPPFYYKFTFEELKGHYDAITAAVDLPMLVYAFPAFSGVDFGLQEIGELFLNPKVAGIKYTANDFFKLERVRAAYPEKIIFNGYDEMMLCGLVAGADGGIGSTYNFMADKFVRLYGLFRAEKLSDARRLQSEINTVIAALCKAGVMQAEKAVLDALGIPMGHARAPFKPLGKAAEKELLDKVLPLLTTTE